MEQNYEHCKEKMLKMKASFLHDVMLMSTRKRNPALFE